MNRGDPTKDLSGAWRGMYSYPIPGPPVAFEATLAELASRLSGVTEEMATAVGKLTATLDGRRDGGSVSWLKRYDDLSRRRPAIRYAGEVSADGNEISGTWTIPGSWSGTFLMIRASSLETAAERAVAERI